MSGLRNSDIPFDMLHSYFILFQQQKKRIGRKNQALCSLILSHSKEQSVPVSSTCREPPYPLGAKRLNYTRLRALESIASSFSPVHLSIFRIKLLTSESFTFFLVLDIGVMDKWHLAGKLGGWLQPEATGYTLNRAGVSVKPSFFFL